MFVHHVWSGEIYSKLHRQSFSILVSIVIVFMIVNNFWQGGKIVLLHTFTSCIFYNNNNNLKIPCATSPSGLTSTPYELTHGQNSKTYITNSCCHPLFSSSFFSFSCFMGTPGDFYNWLNYNVQGRESQKRCLRKRLEHGRNPTGRRKD